jgi:hypothetical protein
VGALAILPYGPEERPRKPELPFEIVVH